MKIAFKTHSQNPNNTTTMSQYPWVSETISPEKESAYAAQGYYVFDPMDYDQYLIDHAGEASTWETVRYDSTLRIRDLLHPEFVNYHPSKIDFTMHLLPNTLLVKKITMAKNGRPVVAKYYHPTTGEIVCEIKYEFIDNGSRFMIDRKEKLGYYQNNGLVPAYYTIHHRSYDFNILNEATESLAERVEARGNIIQEVKIVCHSFMVGMYMAQGQNVTQASTSAITLGQTFFNAFRLDIADFIEVASDKFKINIAADTTFTWIDGNIAPGVTLRQYIVDRVTY